MRRTDNGGPGRARGRRAPQIPTVVQAVADDIRKRVLDGEFEPGKQLRENDLLDDYGIARHGIRSALHGLAHEGLLRHQPHHGVFVPDADPVELADVVTTRLALELEAIRLIVERGLDLEPITEAVEQLEAVPESASWSELLTMDLAVHRAIVDAVGSRRMSRVHDSLVAEAALFLAFHGLKEQQRSRIRQTHRRFVDAILAGNVDVARSLVANDLREGLSQITDGARERSES